MKRISLVAVLSLLAGILGIVGSAPRAYAHNSPSTGVSSDSPQPYGHALTLTATVGGDLGLDASPQGTVDFYEVITETHQVFLTTATLHDIGGATSVTNGAPYCCLSVGTHTVRGYYTSTNGQNPSSGTITVEVTKASTSTSLAAPSGPNFAGDPLTFTATIHRSTGQGDHVTGFVDFSEGPVGNRTTYKTVAVDGTTETAQATFTLPPGLHLIDATYTGDDSYTGSTTALPEEVAVSQRNVTDALAVSATDITYGTAVTFTSTVAPTSPTALVPSGTVRIWKCVIFDQCPPGTFPAPTQIGTGTLNQGSPNQATFTTSALPVGTESLFSEYVGDVNFVGTGSRAVTVHVTKADSTTDLSTSTPTTLTAGQTSTFDAVVSGPNGSPATGSVQFKDGSSDLGAPQPITNNAATLSLALPAGTHNISVVYGGDGNLFGSSSHALTVIVNKIDTTTAVVGSAPSTALGQPVTFAATVTPASGGAPTGTVQFKDGTTDLGAPRPVVGGVAALTLSTLAGGDHVISAVYSGDAAHNGSTGTVAHTVVCDRVISGQQTSLTASPGTTCLTSANVGSIAVPAGARLSLVNTTVRGSIIAKGGAGPITICGTHVSGSVKISRATGFVVIGDTSEGCAANVIDGGVALSHNTGGLELGFNHVGGRVTVSGNVGAGPAPNHTSPQIEANTIGGNLACSGNSPLASDPGPPNSVTGRKIGECSAPGF